MELGIDGRIALVTGASKGLGLGIAQALAAEGARVAMSSRSRERIDAAAAEVPGARGFVHDSADVDGAGRLIDAVQDELGALEILVTNTGGPPAGDPLSFTREQWEAAYRSLVLGPMAMIEHAVPAMRERGWGRVVNVSSYAVREPIPYLMLSNAHRSATLAAFKTLARELAGDGITLNTVLAGMIATDRLIELRGRSREAVEEDAREQVPAGRPGRVEEFAAAAAFLCSDGAGYITGAALAVDGGLLRSV
ncbi:MAG TPA: SDR family oxidoreductase [Solirubrobacteraceae bacterium]|nr:SDR family oxidoreductase [Solirubrobacteraceae bacterium]